MTENMKKYMKKRQVLIRSYTANNLGDDLMVYILIHNFPNVDFYTDNYYDFSTILDDINNYKALPLIHNQWFEPLNKLLRFLFSFRVQTTVEIGGSIFMFPEATQQIVKRLKRQNRKNYFIIGANFGPYSDEEDRQLGLTLFQKINSVVFREKYSYDLFPELTNSDYAADIVFNYLPKTNIEQKDQIVISIVNYTRFKNGESYVKTIIELAEYYMLQNKKVILLSFCETEGDDITSNRVETYFRVNRREYANQLTTHTHKRLKDSLEIIQESQIIIASRFHAMILGWIHRKQTIVLPYSNKFTNVIQDLFPEQTYFMIEDLADVTIGDIVNSYFVADENRLNQYKSEAYKHFAKLEQALLEDFS